MREAERTLRRPSLTYQDNTAAADTDCQGTKRGREKGAAVKVPTTDVTVPKRRVLTKLSKEAWEMVEERQRRADNEERRKRAGGCGRSPPGRAQ